MLRLGLLLICNIIIQTSYSQELKKKNKFSNGYKEEFTVLKDDKTVKHGQYIKFRVDPFRSEAITTVGFYENNEKVGQWLYFSFRGYLQKEGNYSNSKKYGLWIEYYEPKPSAANALNSVFEVNMGVAITENGELQIERSDLIKSSEGVFSENEKIGAWNYYATDGSLMHKFDHDSGKLLYEAIITDSLAFPFLGGRSRFLRNFGSLQRFDNNSYYKTFKISIERKNTKINYKANHPETDKTLAQLISKLRELETEFIWNDNNSLLFTIELIPNDGGMFGRFEIDFKNWNAN